MNRKIADKWIAALRSGEFNQTRERLADMRRTEHCCLGVLCELAIKDDVEMEVFASVDARTYFDGDDALLPERVAEWAGMSSRDGALPGFFTLADLNDDGRSFEDIADVIEEHWGRF